METLALIVPVMKNFKGLAKLMNSVDRPVLPIVINNWDYNHGVSKGWNHGLSRCLYDDIPYAVICNDDVTLAPGTLDKLVESVEGLDLVSAVNSDTGQAGLHFDGFPDYSCFAVKPSSFVDKFGYFDEWFSPAYFEDNDMHYRIEMAGGTSALRLDARIYHEGSVTQNMDGNRVVSHEMFEENRAYYMRKWGGWPKEEKFKTPFNLPNMTIKDW